MRPSKWLVFIRPSLAGFDRPLTKMFMRVMLPVFLSVEYHHTASPSK